MVLVLMVAEVLARHVAFVPAIAGHRRPGELERQQNQHEDREPTTHGEKCSSYKDWRWSDEDKGVSTMHARRSSAFRRSLDELEGEGMSRRRCTGTSRQELQPAVVFTTSIQRHSAMAIDRAPKVDQSFESLVFGLSP
jgi:hypothetical protein